jgi:hypothetical protein
MGLLTTASPCALVLVPLAYVSAIAAITSRCQTLTACCVHVYASLAIASGCWQCIAQCWDPVATGAALWLQGHADQGRQSAGCSRQLQHCCIRQDRCTATSDLSSCFYRSCLSCCLACPGQNMGPDSPLNSTDMTTWHLAQVRSLQGRSHAQAWQASMAAQAAAATAPETATAQPTIWQARAHGAVCNTQQGNGRHSHIIPACGKHVSHVSVSAVG